MGKRKRRQNLPRPHSVCANGRLAFSPNKEEAERTERIFQEARAERARERDEIDEMAQEGVITVTCEFCSEVYTFEPAELKEGLN